jgi:hypothetical protein
MALVSPGVQVSIIDESFYTPAEPGTTPLIFIATTENKPNPGGTGIAPGTLASNAEKVYLMSSQRELSETFGDALFYTDLNNNPIHGGEQNEYGLQAAYSFLGVSNRAFVVRADIDLASLDASAEETAGKPTNGAYWFDTDDTLYGIFEWNAAPATATNGQSFSNKLPTTITDTTKVVDFAGADYTPKGSVGAVGDYAVVAVTNINKLWYKATDGVWYIVGSTGWVNSIPTVTGTSTVTVADSETFTIDDGSGAITLNIVGTVVADFVTQINDETNVSAELVNGRLVIYADGTNGNSLVIGGTASTTGIASATYTLPKLTIAPHTAVPQYKTGGDDVRPSGSVWLKTTTPNLGANWNVKVYNSATGVWAGQAAPIYSTNHAALFALDQTGGGANISEGSLYIQSNVAEDTAPTGSFKIYRKNSTGATSITSAKVTTQVTTATYTFTIQESVVGSATLTNAATVSFDATGATTDADVLANAINTAGLTHVTSSVDSQNRVIISHNLGGEIRLVDTDEGLTKIFTVFDADNSASTTNLYHVPGTDGSTSPVEYMVSHWKVLNYTASVGEPTTTPADGALWYSSIVDEVDMMYHDGTAWVGYANAVAAASPGGPLVAASAPLEQSDGTALEEGDLWISTADIENYPTIYRRTTAGTWDLIDKTDQTSENGILFADARYNTAGANSDVAGDIVEMLASDYLDPDAPDPALYPRGMLLWNLRRSGFNVKRFERDYIDINGLNIRLADESMNGYAPNRWVTESANNADGSGSFGRIAQRKVIVQKLQAVVNSSDDARDSESRNFNLLATPGYPELIGEMINLNFDRGLTAFVIGDSPLRLSPNTTKLNNWATNVDLVVEDNDAGLVSRDEYLGVYYPAGFTSDNSGNNIVVPASHMVLRTFALNDQVAYPWFAPAGTRRGGVTNATAAGYISNEGEFVSISLNEGQRNTLQASNVNPITFLGGSGLVIFGQKTRARNSSSLDRVNVARLVIYLRSQLKQLSKPYIFEPNDKLTRNEIKQEVESLMVELVSLRALYDFLVVCDESNNTQPRIDRGELYIDIAIEPVKAVEFIYIPLRLKNTGEIAGL